MPEFRVNVPVEQLCVLVRHEAEGNYHVNGRKQYLVAEVDEHLADTPQRKALLKGTLDVEPLAEQNYWTLRLEATRDLGPANPDDESAASESELSIEDFEEEFLAADTRKTAFLTAQTEEARRAFEEWLRDAALQTVDMMPLTIPLYRG